MREGVKASLFVGALFIGLAAWDAYPKFTWFGNMRTAAAMDNWVVIPGTAEAVTHDLASPFTWFKGYVGHAWLAPVHYKGADEGKPEDGPIGVLICSINEQERTRDEFWMLFSSDRASSKMVNAGIGLDGKPIALKDLLAVGDSQFDGRKVGNHNAVLRFIQGVPLAD